jgi:threonine aldolase
MRKGRAMQGSQKVFDFRSDLMSGCDDGAEGIIEAMRSPHHFGYREDPNQIRLEAMISEMTGREDALLVPTCTLANQIAVRLWQKADRSILADVSSHLVTTEARATATLNPQARSLRVDAPRGHLTHEHVTAALSADGGHDIGLVWTENTHMRAGGTTAGPHILTEIGHVCRANAVPVHLDGSRLWNASVAQSTELSTLATGADSLALSLNKGVGAPMGSLLLGTKDFIEEAVVVRESFGGAWRPVGMIAAAAISAVKHYEARIRMDHARAAVLAEKLQNLVGGVIRQVDKPDTNIVLLRLRDAMAQKIQARLTEESILTLALDVDTLRFVTHSRIDDFAIVHTVAILDEIVTSCGDFG